jgi:hypothetical protein
MEAPGKLALSIVDSIENPLLSAQRGSNARHLVMERFDRVRVVDQIVAMYEAVLKHR